MIIDSQNNGPTRPLNGCLPDCRSETGTLGASPDFRSVNNNGTRGGILHFIEELRRRHVCRVATTYAVVMWLICEIVELITPAFDLPVWTLKFVIVVGLLGLPIVLVLSWLLDITPNGLVLENGDPARQSLIANAEARRPADRVIDCALFLVATAIGGQLALGLLGTETVAAEGRDIRVAIEPFEVVAGSDVEVVSQALVVELRREFTNESRVTVIAANGRYLTPGSLSLSGIVMAGEQKLRATLTMVDNESGEVTWAQSFERPRTDSYSEPIELAGDIVAALSSSASAWRKSGDRDED